MNTTEQIELVLQMARAGFDLRDGDPTTAWEKGERQRHLTSLRHFAENVRYRRQRLDATRQARADREMWERNTVKTINGVPQP